MIFNAGIHCEVYAFDMSGGTSAPCPPCFDAQLQPFVNKKTLEIHLCLPYWKSQ